MARQKICCILRTAVPFVLQRATHIKNISTGLLRGCWFSVFLSKKIKPKKSARTLRVRSAPGWYGGDMDETATKRTAKQIQAAEEGWTEIGAALAATVVEGGKAPAWVWQLIKPLGLYKRWMVTYWIKKYEDLHAERLAELRKKKRSRKKILELVPVLDSELD